MTEQVPVFVQAAQGFRSGQVRLDVMLRVLRDTTLYARRPEQPGLFVAEVADGVRWTFVYSTVDALARHSATLTDTSAGVDYFSTSGADVLDNLLPADIGLLIDPDEEHALALPPDWLTSDVPHPGEESGASAGDHRT